MAGACGGEFAETIEGAHPSGSRKLGLCETVKSTMSQRPPLPPSFHISNSPKFHVANIQILLTKRKLGKKGMFTVVAKSLGAAIIAKTNWKIPLKRAQ